jgi:hypothetical protein
MTIGHLLRDDSLTIILYYLWCSFVQTHSFLWKEEEHLVSSTINTFDKQSKNSVRIKVYEQLKN